MRVRCDNMICAMSTFRDGSRTEGLAIAGSIGGLLAALGIVLATDWSAPAVFILPLSLPVGLMLAWRHAPAVAAATTFPIARVVVMSLQALVLGALLVGITSELMRAIVDAEALISLWDLVGRTAMTAVLGVIILGLPMLGVIVPVVALWAVLVRRRVRARPRAGPSDSGSWRRAALWAAVTVASVVDASLVWPLFGVLGVPEIGWFVSLLLWLVLAPIALILLAANLIGAVRHGCLA